MLCSQLAASTKDTNQPANVTAGGPLRSCFLPRVTCSVASGDATAAAAARETGDSQETDADPERQHLSFPALLLESVSDPIFPNSSLKSQPVFVPAARFFCFFLFLVCKCCQFHSIKAERKECDSTWGVNAGGPAVAHSQASGICVCVCYLAVKLAVTMVTLCILSGGPTGLRPRHALPGSSSDGPVGGAVAERKLHL